MIIEYNWGINNFKLNHFIFEDENRLADMYN